MSRTLTIKQLTSDDFAPFGEVLNCDGAPDKLINNGLCERFHDRAKIDVDGQVGISLFRSQLRRLPYKLELVERHPLGSQAFIPMSPDPFLVIVACRDLRPLAFETAPGEAISFHRGTWHGVLTPLDGPGLFAVVDRVSPGPNLQEHYFEQPYLITR